MKELRFEHQGVVYTTKKLREITGISPSAARVRMNQILKGKISIERFLAPPDPARQVRKIRYPVEDLTSEQESMLDEFNRITRNDAHIIKKYYSQV